MLYYVLHLYHDDVIKWKYFPRYWPFVRQIHQSPVNSTHKSRCCGALMFSLICAWTHGWVNHRDTGDLRGHRAHYEVTVMILAVILRLLLRTSLNVIKWKHFSRYWPFVRGIHRSPVNSPHKSQWRGPLMFSLIWARINSWLNNGEAGVLRCHRAYYDIIVIDLFQWHWLTTVWPQLETP